MTLARYHPIVQPSHANEGSEPMNVAAEHRGVPYAVPNTDDGNWRWVIYAAVGRKSVVALNAQPRPIYPTRGEAVQAANPRAAKPYKRRNS